MDYSLKGLRTAQRLTQSEVARKLGLSQTTVAEVEAGKRSLSDNLAEKLASVLGTDAVSVKHAHASAEITARLDAVANLNAEDLARFLTPANKSVVSRALRALDSLAHAGGDMAPEIKAAATKASGNLAQRITEAIEKASPPDDRDFYGRHRPRTAAVKRDNLGRARENAPIERDSFGRRKDKPNG